MTPDDQHDDQHDDGLTAREDAVRRLLADARHAEPMPADVAARIDAVLAGLGTSDDGPPVSVAPVDPEPGVVVELAARRRRKVLVGLVAAAAVVVVAGVGVREVATQTGEVDDASDSAQVADAGEPADRGEAAGTTAGDADKVPDPDTTSPSSAPSAVDQLDDALGPDGRLTLRSGSFLADVTRLADLDRSALRSVAAAVTDTPAAPAASPDPDGAGGATGASSGAANETSSDLGACVAGGLGPGLLLAVSYDGVPAVLAIRPRQGQSQVVDLLACEGTVLRSVTLPRS